MAQTLRRDNSSAHLRDRRVVADRDVLRAKLISIRNQIIDVWLTLVMNCINRSTGQSDLSVRAIAAANLAISATRLRAVTFGGTLFAGLRLRVVNRDRHKREEMDYG